MTDSEKLDLLLVKVTAMDGRFDKQDGRLDNLESKFDRIEIRLDNLENRFDNLENRFDNLENRFDNLENRFDNLESRFDKLELTVEGMQGDIAALKNGQKEIRMDIKRLDQRMDDTYQLALEAWGTSIENRVLITN